MFKKKAPKEIDAALCQSVNFELTIADLARRSERRAWWVACTAIVLTLIMAGVIFYMIPLKEKVPFLVMADGATGVATVARLTDEANVQNITSSEAINRSNVAHFVRARESYDSVFLNMHDWNTVLTMASPGVAAAYRNLFTSENPDNPYKTYGQQRSIRVNILSIVLSGGGPGRTPTGATVRFQRSVYNKETGGTVPLDNKIAMMAFIYKSNLSMDDRARLENPLGFQVTSYQVDNDYSSPLPAPTASQPTEPASPPTAEASSAIPPPPIPAASAAPAPTVPPSAAPHRRRYRSHHPYGT